LRPSRAPRCAAAGPLLLQLTLTRLLQAAARSRARSSPPSPPPSWAPGAPRAGATAGAHATRRQGCSCRKRSPFFARLTRFTFFAPAHSAAMAASATGVSRIGLCGLAVMGQVRLAAGRRTAVQPPRSRPPRPPV
jgi:hypothetical protein